MEYWKKILEYWSTGVMKDIGVVEREVGVMEI
jgi:hypothetical protein